ncbi:MAG: efflux RND transporter permease subunit [Alphaproteobacteria bacterium]|nr:efflux RND transporter permease subunit [Alphaproteobacteria bacterium]
MSGFNLSAWGLRHQTLVLFLVLASLAAGLSSYFSLGRAEDPEFTIKTMVVSAYWPGASAREMELQVADRLEKKLQEVPWFDHVTSYSRPGESLLKVNLRPDMPKSAVPDAWYQVRKKLGDIRANLPQGVQGPFFNDEFGDTFGTIYAFSGEDFSQAELRHIVEEARQRLLRLPDVSKVETVGLQEERIFVEFSHRRLASLGITAQQIFDSLQRYTGVSAAGMIETPTDRVRLRIAGNADSVEEIGEVPVLAAGRTLRIGDIAEIRRGYQDPPSFAMRWNGRPVVGLAVSMAKGGDILELGTRLNAEIERLRAELPVGVEVDKVADQPRVVRDSIGEFLKVLLEALAIVLAVSFISLGLRTGVVVALSVPLVLAITFVLMEVLGIDLHRISLGALIIALGLLVDDAIIAVEMMMVKMEQGYDRIRAATFAYTSTAFPMLTGTLITAAGFLPVGFARSAAGEYTNAIFWVVGISLIVSWLVAVLFTPYLGYRLLPDPKAGKHGEGDLYDRPLYRLVRRAVVWCVTWRKTVILLTLLAFALSAFSFRFVQQQFFPASARLELLVDLRLPNGASFAATEKATARLEKELTGDPDVVNWVAYVGGGTPRFYLALNPELRNANYAQFVIMTSGLEARERLLARLNGLFESGFEELRGRVTRLENGPPVGYPVQFRVIGPDPAKIREIAGQVRDIMRASPHARDVNLEWNELSKAVRIELDRERARQLGIDPQALSGTLNTLMSGLRVAQFREGTELIDIVARAVPAERVGLDELEGVNVGTANGTSVPLGQIARISYGLEEPILWRRNRDTMIAVRADVAPGVQAPSVTAEIEPRLATLRASLPIGYRIEVGGAVEESARSQQSIFKLMPLMALIMVTLLMIQLQSFQKLLLVLLTAPLGLIGVTGALLVSGQPFGFVAMLGVISLAGMIMRNSVILVDQIDQDLARGLTMAEAIVGATTRRARPIVLTALTAILAMIPLSRSVFWGPMAIAIMGGLAVATLLTLFFLPALYAAWFCVPIRADAPQAVPDAVPAPAE